MAINGNQLLIGAVASLALSISIADVANAQEAILMDGSSTVFPITEAVAEAYARGDSELGIDAVNPRARIAIGVSGTGGGFRKFCAGESVVSNASRPIKEEEVQACADAGIEYVEIPVAIDALTVVVNPENTWATEMTVEQLNQLWDEGSTVSRWNQIDPTWPDDTINLYGPGTDSGTFDYFTEVINGESARSRSDYTASEDDNILVIGVERDVNAFAYFGYSYYIEEADRLQAVGIDNGEGPVLPSPETVADGTYTPLSRPLFIYVNTEALAENPELQSFMSFYLEHAMQLVPTTGYIPLDESEYADALSTVQAAAR